MGYNPDWITAKDPKAYLAGLYGLPTSDVLLANVVTELRLQPFFVAADRLNKRIVVVSRGGPRVQLLGWGTTCGGKGRGSLTRHSVWLSWVGLSSWPAPVQHRHRTSLSGLGRPGDPPLAFGAP